jgi:hypothetical protein
MDEKYYTYVEPGWDDEPVYHTWSEQDIRKEWYPYWDEQMAKKYGASYKDKYNFQDCVEDFCIVHWAWKSDKNGKKQS